MEKVKVKSKLFLLTLIIAEFPRIFHPGSIILQIKSFFWQKIIKKSDRMHRIFRITILSKEYYLIDKIDIRPFIIAASLCWALCSFKKATR